MPIQPRAHSPTFIQYSKTMFHLTHQERKILIGIGALLVLGAGFRIFRVNSILEKAEGVEAVVEKLIDINRACQEELITIPFIGEKTAQRILEYREVNGEFRIIEDLLEVKGIGEKKLGIIRKHIAINPEIEDGK